MSPNFGYTTSKAWRQFLCCYATASILLFLPVPPASAQSEDCGLLGATQDLNTFEGRDGRTVIGQLRRRPYVVVLTRDLQENLPAVRSCVPDAFLTSSRLGSYIHIASFDSYREAKTLGANLTKALDLRVRVVHLNRLRQ